MSSNAADSRTGALPYYHLPQCGAIQPLEEDHHDHIDLDARGLIKLWEPPRRNARYVMGVDPTSGILNWTRQHRDDQDMKTDNGAIEIIRCGNGRDSPDVQVAEYAAPIDAEDLADVVALLGRLYCGSSESGEALCIIETWPGPGMLTLRRLLGAYGYSNLFRFEYLDTPVPRAQNVYGWQSNTKTLQLLWSRFSRHLGRGMIHVKSRWLYDELADLQHIPGKTFPQPSGEQAHDDRVRALAMASWGAHDWSLAESAPEPQRIRNTERPRNWQASDCSVESMEAEWEEIYQSMMTD